MITGPLLKGYDATLNLLDQEHMITTEVMLEPSFEVAALYSVRVPTHEDPHNGSQLPAVYWDRFLATVRHRAKGGPRPTAALNEVQRSEEGIFHTALKAGLEIVQVPPGSVGMKDRGARLTLSMAGYTDQRWKCKLGSFQDKRKEMWDTMSVDAQAMFAADQNPIDVSGLPTLLQKAIVNSYETHCGPFHLLWLQMYIYEKTASCITRWSIHHSIKTGEDRLEKTGMGVDDTKEPPPKKRGRDNSPTTAAPRIT